MTIKERNNVMLGRFKLGERDVKLKPGEERIYPPQNYVDTLGRRVSGSRMVRVIDPDTVEVIISETHTPVDDQMNEKGEGVNVSERRWLEKSDITSYARRGRNKLPIRWERG